MKSNFLKVKAPEPVLTNTSALEDPVPEDKVEEPQPILSPEEQAEKKKEFIEQQIQK